MSMSGIKVAEEVKDAIGEQKKPSKSKPKFVTMKIKDKKEIVLAEIGEPADTETKDEDKVEYAKLQALLTDEPRYILYDFGFVGKEKRKIKKLGFIVWCPDTAKIGEKMLYASSKDAIKSQLDNVPEIQCNDKGDLEYEAVVAQVDKKL